jgi:acetyl coenzyme A synthetase (ADP forming)-like protein
MTSSASGASCDVVLRDGSTVTFRPSHEGDADQVRNFFLALSPESHYQRFHGYPNLSEARIRRLVTARASDACTLLAMCGTRIIAVAGFYRDPGSVERAEAAFAIADAFQGRGVGTRLLERLTEIAVEAGIRFFDAYVRADNQKMLSVFLDSGYALTQKVESGVNHVVLSLTRSPVFAEKAAKRAQVAATASMRAFFEPSSVSVVGASRKRGRIGSEILHNLIDAGFTGTLSAVHPTAKEIQGVAAYPSVASIPGPVDLAVIAVPAESVLQTVDDCIVKGVRGICVISAGFGEAGAEGAAREAALVEKVRDAGCRLIGPNCMGLLNTAPAARLNATFSPVYPPAGGVAMSTQSGALGLAILDYAQRLNIGISSFVSVGNKADVSSNDLIQYWADDPNTSVILLYLESFGNPKKFTEIARRVSRSKPIVAVKSGRSRAGARAASSHTGALAASDVVVDALFRQAGVIRTTRLEELFDVATLLSHQPLPAGRRVAIVTNAGGPAILAADACEAGGLELASLSDATRTELRSFLPASASVGNPVDMLASASPSDYRRTLDTVLSDEGVDSVVVIFIPPLVTESDEVASAIQDAAAKVNGKPIQAVFMRADGAPAALAPIPCYAFPESAAIALARVTAYAAWRRTPPGVVREFADIRPERVRRPVDAALARGGGWLTADENAEVMAGIGINHAVAKVVSTPSEAVAAAAVLGLPVALKGLGPALLHKTEKQAVVLDLDSAKAVRDAAGALASRLGDELTGYLVQRMVPGGIEMLVGAINDPLFGPTVVCGTGGVLAELLADSASRLHPVTPPDAAEMIEELRGARLLRGYRGNAPGDAAALQDAILRVSTLLAICPEVQELDINPIKVLTEGVCAVDVRISVERPKPRSVTRRIEY